MFRPVILHSGNIRHIRHRTAGIGIGMQHDGIRRKNFGGFSHEPDAAENDHWRTAFFRLETQFQRVPDEIRDVLNLSVDIVVREDHSIALLFQLKDFPCNAHSKNRQIKSDRGRRKEPR
ncbi:hypothetical protein SDC9_162919 [bioreactor metagenome]|uniref:Uncharacterized protein n=1 Tax=bioreactor metagenome TaxID=1076179 RepID=A0A645FME1_9ZZZZ